MLHACRLLWRGARLATQHHHLCSRLYMRTPSLNAMASKCWQLRLQTINLCLFTLGLSSSVCFQLKPGPLKLARPWYASRFNSLLDQGTLSVKMNHLQRAIRFALARPLRSQPPSPDQIPKDQVLACQGRGPEKLLAGVRRGSTQGKGLWASGWCTWCQATPMAAPPHSSAGWSLVRWVRRCWCRQQRLQVHCSNTADKPGASAANQLVGVLRGG